MSILSVLSVLSDPSHPGFENKTVILSGGASGMGFLCGKCFAKEGANVVLADINEEALSEKVAEITAEGGKAVGAVCDVRKYEDVQSVCRKAVDTFGSIDVMVNCAGGAECRMCGVSGKFFELPIEVLDWGLDVNLRGQFYFDHAVLKTMAEQKSGVIINIGSVTGLEGSAENVAYATSKSGAMNGLTKSVASAGAKYGVRCVCVSPGPVLTRPGMAKMKTLLGRAAEPEEIVDLILYLASDKAASVTGTNVTIDCGRSAGYHNNK